MKKGFSFFFNMLFLLSRRIVYGQEYCVSKSLKGFDRYIERILAEMNAVGPVVGIVIEKQLPFTPKTLFPIAFNTELFRAVAMGMLVAERLLPHRTGVSRHNLIGHKSEFSQKELYDRLVYLSLYS